MAKLWFTADWHLGEPRMTIMQRPHKDAQHDYEVIRDNHNAMVGKDDLVIVVGDAVCMRSDNPHLWLPKVDNFNGRKWLVMGNHDAFFERKTLEPYFEKIINHGDGIEIDLHAPYNDWSPGPRVASNGNDPTTEAPDDELNLFVTHYPTRSRVDRFNLVGHIHAAWKYQKNMLNVGVDVNHFRPYASEEIKFYLTAIEKFYDDDVWVANHKANALYEDSRGKRGSYFNKLAED